MPPGAMCAVAAVLAEPYRAVNGVQKSGCWKAKRERAACGGGAARVRRCGKGCGGHAGQKGHRQTIGFRDADLCRVTWYLLWSCLPGVSMPRVRTSKVVAFFVRLLTSTG